MEPKELNIKIKGNPDGSLDIDIETDNKEKLPENGPKPRRKLLD